MARVHVNHFTAPGTGNRAYAKIGFYSNSNAATPVTVYADQYGPVVIPAVFADNQGVVAAELWVDSTVASSLYARSESPGTTATATVAVGTISTDTPQAAAINLIDCGNAA